MYKQENNISTYSYHAKVKPIIEWVNNNKILGVCVCVAKQGLKL